MTCALEEEGQRQSHSYRRISVPQPGSIPKRWDREELRRCRATGTTEQYATLNLVGEIHPVFANWTAHHDHDTEGENANEDKDSIFFEELKQPLLLASKILEAVGLPWLSDFFIQDDAGKNNSDHDQDDYDPFKYTSSSPSPSPSPGSAYSQSSSRSSGHSHNGVTGVPQAIARHHRASWASPELKRKWLDDTRHELRGAALTRYVEWQLDASMFCERGWVGYTCRHRRTAGMTLDSLDSFEAIAGFDQDRRRSDGEREEGEYEYRALSVLVMSEFPARLCELKRLGKGSGEEYLLTAFMATVTILHELGHVAYWKDRQSLTTADLREPFYGADLEMELGDSFVASIFGGWIPVPIDDIARCRRQRPGGGEGRGEGKAEGEGPTFDAGIAWRQSLSWDYHRIRPKYRAHYSIPVDYVARLFRDESWSPGNDLKKLIQPQTLTTGENSSADFRFKQCQQGGLLMHVSHEVGVEGMHATAALPDFHRCSSGEGWRWNRRPGASFRIPQYDGYMCPEIDLPFATDDVVREREVRPPSSSSIATATSRKVASAVRDDSRNRRQDKIRGTSLAFGAEGGDVIPKPSSSHHKSEVPNSKTPPDTRKKEDNAVMVIDLSPKKKGDNHQAAPKRVFFGQAGVVDVVPRPSFSSSTLPSSDRCEISVDELKNRLSQLIGVSIGELEKLFDTPRCG